MATHPEGEYEAYSVSAEDSQVAAALQTRADKMSNFNSMAHQAHMSEWGVIVDTALTEGSK
jgi:hypothetical protein